MYNQPLEKQWCLIVKEGCPYCKKAEDYLRSKQQSFLSLTALTHADAKKYEASHDLLSPVSYKTFPRVFCPQSREFLGGYSDLIKATFGNVTYSLDRSISASNKARIRLVLNTIAPLYFVYCTFDEHVFTKQPSHVHFKLLKSNAMMQDMVSNPYLNCTQKQVQPYANFSVTFLNSTPRFVYLNQTNWDNVNNSTSHFKVRSNYHTYVVLHELAHSIGYRYHQNDSYNDRLALSDGSVRQCKVLTQQTRAKYKYQKCRLMNTSHFVKFLDKFDANRVENSFRNNSTSNIISGGYKMSHVTDTYSYSMWFDPASQAASSAFIDDDLQSGATSFTFSDLDGGDAKEEATSIYTGTTTSPKSAVQSQATQTHVLHKKKNQTYHL